jgi:hypothetical protein
VGLTTRRPVALEFGGGGGLRVAVAPGCCPSTPPTVAPFGERMGVTPVHPDLPHWTPQVPPFPSQLSFVQPYPPPVLQDEPPAASHDCFRLLSETLLIGCDFAAHASLAIKVNEAIVINAISLLRIEASFKKCQPTLGV